MTDRVREKLFLKKKWKIDSIGGIDKSRRDAMDKIKRLLDTDLGLYVDLLTEVRKIGYFNTIARELQGLISSIDTHKASSTKTIIKGLKKLLKHGIRFLAGVHTARLGLYTLFVFAPYYIDLYKLPYVEWIHFYALTRTPIGTIVVYYIPAPYVEPMVALIKRELSEYVRSKMVNNSNRIFPENKVLAVLFEDKERLQPLFNSKSGVRSNMAHFRYLVNGYTIEELNELFNRSINDRDVRTDITKNIVKPVKYKPYDIIDLILLKEYQQDAFKPVDDMVLEYNILAKIMKKHLEKHVNSQHLVRGIYLPSIYFISVFQEPILILLTFREKEYFNAVSGFLRQLAPTAGLYYATGDVYNMYGERVIDELGTRLIDNDKYTLLVGLYNPINGEDIIYRFLISRLVEDEYVTSIRIMNYMGPKSYKRTIPYTNYSQEKRNWTIETEISYTYFIRRLLRDNIGK